ncbi:THY1 Predicted alternative thymidylate synthase [uncultured Caudovirales phage]|uniref:THY1 Predicted alternative thymidylate synthase n=1 Tax=uncultured Caudovirales phage TaxID=2100421 RepID=A0A6J5KQN2_9CAUD|nr:THY1 Predicted alternative thymidylate synthase [uncultured Caudovirales phage]
MADISFRSDMTVELVDYMASDSAVAMAARVSTVSGTHQEVVDLSKDAGLINYLMRDRHGSPFEHNAFTFYIEAPLFVFREFQRHRMASYNEESGRYKELEPVFYVPAKDRKIIQVGKPGAYTFEDGDYAQRMMVPAEVMRTSDDAYLSYKRMLNQGIAREVARMVLPLNIYSSMYVTMNARSLMNFLSLRSLEQGTYPSFPQQEIADVATQMELIFSEKMPITHDCFVKNGRVAP